MNGRLRKKDGGREPINRSLKKELKIPNGRPSATGLEIFLVLQDEGHDQVDDQRRPKGDKRSVNEVLPYRTCLDSKLSAPPVANAKGLSFEEVVDTVHGYTA